MYKSFFSCEFLPHGFGLGLLDKTAYVGGQDFRPQLRFSCSVASVLQRFVPPCIVMTILILITTVIVIL